MIRQSNRFHGYGSLRYVYNRGKAVRGPVLGLRYSLNHKRDSFRVAVVVSKKISKSAVARNRMRRRVYETVRQLTLAIDQPYDLVLTVFQDTLNQLTPAELEQQVKKLLDQAGALNPGKLKPPTAKGHAMIEAKERTKE